jgi:hypothetical protein
LCNVAFFGYTWKYICDARTRERKKKINIILCISLNSS